MVKLGVHRAMRKIVVRTREVPSSLTHDPDGSTFGLLSCPCITFQRRCRGDQVEDAPRAARRIRSFFIGGKLAMVF